MSTQEHVATEPHPFGPGQFHAPKPDEPRPRIGLRVDLRVISPGVVELEALPDHRLMIHAGAPVRGACRFHHFTYTRGDVDILPAGLSDVWEPAGTSASLILQLSPSLLRRAAEDMGLDPDRAGLEPRHQFRDPQIEHIAWALDAERKAGYPGGLLYTESLGMGLAVHLLGPLPCAPQSAARTVTAAAAARDGIHRGAPRSRSVTGPARRRRRGQRFAPQDFVQALDRTTGA